MVLSPQSFSCPVVPCGLKPPPLNGALCRNGSINSLQPQPTWQLSSLLFPKKPLSHCFCCLARKELLLSLLDRIFQILSSKGRLHWGGYKLSQREANCRARSAETWQSNLGANHSLVLLSAKEVFPLPQNLSAVNWPVPPLFILISMKLCYL